MKSYEADEMPLICARCAAESRPGQGNFYVVRIEAFADQVYRRLVLHLCGPCYRQWIENPTG